MIEERRDETRTSLRPTRLLKSLEVSILTFLDVKRAASAAIASTVRYMRLVGSSID